MLLLLLELPLLLLLLSPSRGEASNGDASVESSFEDDCSNGERPYGWGGGSLKDDPSPSPTPFPV